MTDPRPNPAWTVIAEGLRKWAVAGVVLVLTAVTVSARDKIGALLTLPDTLANYTAAADARFSTVEAGLSEIKADIAQLQQPSRIFELAMASAPVDGYCIAGHPCDFVLVIRRLPTATGCRIVGDETIYAFVSADLTMRREVQRIDTNGHRNVGDDWSELRLTVITPNGFPEQSAFLFVASYSNCGGPNDPARILQESPLVPVRILSAPPTNP